MLWQSKFIIISALLINLMVHTNGVTSHLPEMDVNIVYSDPPGVTEFLAVKHGEVISAGIEEKSAELLDVALREDYEILKSPRNKENEELRTVTRRFLENYQKKLSDCPERIVKAGKYSGINSQTNLDNVIQLTDLQLKAIALELGFIKLSPRKHNYPTTCFNMRD
jgi:predicted fused transcriptional regulator/phosphomethylpyrimidine kinase